MKHLIAAIALLSMPGVLFFDCWIGHVTDLRAWYGFPTIMTLVAFTPVMWGSASFVLSTYLKDD